MQRSPHLWKGLALTLKRAFDQQAAGVRPALISIGCSGLQTAELGCHVRCLASEAAEALQAGVNAPHQVWKCCLCPQACCINLCHSFTCVLLETSCISAALMAFSVLCLPCVGSQTEEDLARLRSSRDASTSSFSSAPGRQPAAHAGSQDRRAVIQDLPLPKTGKALAAVMAGIKDALDSAGRTACAYSFHADNYFVGKCEAEGEIRLRSACVQSASCAGDMEHPM